MSYDLTCVGLSVIGKEAADAVAGLIRDVPNFPVAPVLFRDIQPLLASGEAFAKVIEAMALTCAGSDAFEADTVAGMEARGFLLGAPLALRLGTGFLPLRKGGKVPPPVHRVTYQLEYGSASLEIARAALTPGQRVLLVDDVLATGGTAKAAARLIEEAGGVVAGLLVLLELTELGGRAALDGYRVETLLAT